MRSAPEMDPYLVLGVDRRASDVEIRAAYRNLAAKFHPDKHQGNPLAGLAAEKLAEINRAYEILSNPDRRAAYDRGGAGWPRPVPSGWPGARTSPISRRSRRWLILLGLILLFPLLIRIVAALARPVANLFRGGAQALTLVRGTPLLGLLVLVAIAALVLFLIRRRRRRDRPER